MKETRAKYDATFHKATNYGLTVNGKLLGDHDNTGSKPSSSPKRSSRALLRLSKRLLLTEPWGRLHTGSRVFVPAGCCCAAPTGSAS